MTTTAVIIIAAVIVAVLAACFFFRQQRSKKLRSQFGPEYENAVHKYGSSPKAENALVDRQRRIDKLHIHSLPAAERDRFANHWHELQSRFVDEPAGAIEKADQLVCDVMSARGYPMSEFEVRAEDLSVDHPQVVRNYRAAHDISLRREGGETSTEDLRQALVHYRDLFDELLEAHVAEKGNNKMNEATQLEEPISTADLAAKPGANSEAAGPLLPPEFVQELRKRWDGIQTGFVDEPRAAVRQADELVASAIKRLAESFAEARNNLEGQWARGDEINTEDLRVALRKYRSFFQKLMSV